MTVIVLLFAALIWAPQAKPASSNEARSRLAEYIRQAVTSNPLVLAAIAEHEAEEKRLAATLGRFAPQLSLEGGPQSTRFDQDTDQGHTLYGKLEWNLVNGGKDLAERIARRETLELAKRKLNWTRNQISRDVSRVYYQILFLIESLELQEKALSLNAEQMRLARVKARSGFASSTDVIDFELRGAQLRSDMKRSAQDKDALVQELAALLGRDPSTSSDLKTEGHLARPEALRDLTLDQLERKNPSILEAQVELKKADLSLRTVRSGYLPKIDLEAEYGRLASEERVFEQNQNYSVRLKVKLPLFSGLSVTNEYAAQRSQALRQQHLLLESRIKVKAQAENLKRNLMTIQEQLDLEEQTIQRSEEYYRLTLAEYRRGVKNSPDMVGASERLLNARVRNLQYRRDLHLIHLELAALTGSDTL